MNAEDLRRAQILAAFEAWLDEELARPLRSPRYRATRAGLRTARAKLNELKKAELR